MAVRGNTGAIDLIDGASTYTGFDTNSQYSYDPGVMVLPVASEASLTVTVRQHGGYGKRSVTFDITKTGNPPVVPSAEDTVGNDKLVSARIDIPTPTPNIPTGGYDWAVRGQYEYVTTRQPRIPGAAVFPAVSYPYPLEAQDVIASVSVGNLTPTQYQSQLKSTNIIVQDKWLWPLTVYPSNLLGNPSLIGT